jgi:hypothetical protein
LEIGVPNWIAETSKARTGSHVSERSGHGVGVADLGQHPGEPEVSDLGVELRVEQDVAELDVVPVHDRLRALVVHVAQLPRGADGHPVPLVGQSSGGRLTDGALVIAPAPGASHLYRLP